MMRRGEGSRAGHAPAPSIDLPEIAALLPHRFPFQFVDRVLEFEDGTRILALKNVSINEPYFRGHFPEHPLMPGVLLAHRSHDGVAAGRVAVLTGLDDVRFRRPVLPGDQLHLDVRLLKRHRPLWKLHGVARVADHVVAEATLLLTETERGHRP